MPVKKAILNLTSRKKRNTMVTYTNTSSTGAGNTSLAIGDLFIKGDTGGFVLYSPTEMDLTDNSGNPDTVANQPGRTASTCYMRGLSERVRIQSNSGSPWFWRRICFCAKDPRRFSLYASADVPTIPNGGWASHTETSNGFQRSSINQFVNGTVSGYLVNVYEALFKGQQNVDWNDPVTAPVDTRRVDLKYDKLVTITSGNASGAVRDCQLWHPMNKNLVYEDDENGSVMKEAFNSVRDKQGMGDYYVLDLVVPGSVAQATDILQFKMTSTMYWHEK